MAKSKISPEQAVMDFFETADPIKVETVFNIIKGTVKRRLAAAVAAPTPRKTREKKPAQTEAPAASESTTNVAETPAEALQQAA